VSEDTKLVEQELWRNFHNKEYRDAFVSSQLSTNIGSQIFAMREARDWSQEKLATEVGMAQPRISVLEGGYDSYSLRTLKRIASAFDVAVVVRFVPFRELVGWVADPSEERLAPVGFENDNISSMHDHESTPERAEKAAAPIFDKAESALPLTKLSATVAATGWHSRLDAYNMLITYSHAQTFKWAPDVVPNGLWGLNSTTSTASAVANGAFSVGVSVDLTGLYPAKISTVRGEAYNAA
jgi:transcriptional regulator with XRE-family HTH domain